MTPQEAEVLTPTEVAQLLKVHVKTVYRWIDSGRLPAARTGPRTLRLRRSDVDALLRGDAA